jgi:hypothetical protein
MAKITFGTENLVGSRSVTGYRLAAPATYHKGQLIGILNATGIATPFVDGGALGAELAKMVCMKDITLSVESLLPVYLPGSGVQKSGIVDAAGVTLAITQLVLINAQNNNIILEER